MTYVGFPPQTTEGKRSASVRQQAGHSLRQQRRQLGVALPGQVHPVHGVKLAVLGVLKEDTKHDGGVILKDFMYTRMILLDVIEDSLPE